MGRQTIFIAVACAACIEAGAAQIRVNPTWVNTNMTGATTALLTFAGVQGYVPVEAIWCGDITDAAPDIGQKPVPGTIFGRLPVRYDLSTTGGTGLFTDIMSIPPSVTRRAYQAAERGFHSTFFYVRHFASTTGGPDQFVVVTCELSGGGARSPFSITDVQISFAGEQQVLSVKRGDVAPPLSARIRYTGTAELKGRWEVVRPGDEQPSEEDLLTEATLPVEKRAQQKRYPELVRFDVFLPPAGDYTLQGPDPSLLPTDAEGSYLVLLRIEVTGDNQAESDLSTLGAGSGTVVSGGAAGFPIPPLRYFVGADRSAGTIRAVTLHSPEDLTEQSLRGPIAFTWTPVPQASYHRLVVIDPKNAVVFTAMVSAKAGNYSTPPWLHDKVGAPMCSWKVEALDESGNVIAQSSWRTIRFPQ